MIVYVAYADDEIGLPVAEADSIEALADKIGSTFLCVWRELHEHTGQIKKNNFGVPLTVYAVEINYDPRTDTDYDEGGE